MTAVASLTRVRVVVDHTKPTPLTFRTNILISVFIPRQNFIFCQIHLGQALFYVFLWTPAQRQRASMLYFANVFYLFFYGRLILRPWLTEVRESFTRGGP